MNDTLPKSRIEVLDAVRGLAAFWVLLSHSFHHAGFQGKIPLFGDGRIAVDIFMVLSGFLMFYLYRNLGKQQSVGRFWVSRFARISPVYYLLLLVFAVFLPSSPGMDPSTLVLHASYLFGFMPHPAGYGMPDWSIALEMQFYAIFPLLALWLRRSGWYPMVIFAAVLSSLIHLGWSVYDVNEPGLFGRFYQPTLIAFKLPVFLLGGFFADPDFFKNHRRAMVLLLINGMGILIPACYITGYKSTVLLYCVVVAIVIPWRSKVAILSAIRAMIEPILMRRFFGFMGDVSYGVYLLHDVLFITISSLLATHTVWNHWPVILKWGALMLLTIPAAYGLSALLYVLVEKPGIALGKRFGRKLFPQS